MREDQPPEAATLAVHGGGPGAAADAVMARIAVLEGGAGALAAASGTLLAVALGPLMQPGHQAIVATALSASLKGGLAAFASFGWEVREADLDDLAAFERLVGPKTQAIVAPALGEDGAVADLAGLARLARRAGVPLVVDNTLLTPALCRPLDLGADIVVHADARYLAGEGRGVGFIVDGGSFNWLASRRYPALSEPRPKHGGAPLAEAIGNFAYAAACRGLAGDAPFDAAAIAAGIETLPLRMARHSDGARTVADFLAGQARVAAVSCAGLPGDRHHMLAERSCPAGSGAIVGFVLVDGEAAAALRGRLRLVAAEPAPRTARSCLLPVAEGSVHGALRLAVGLEDPADIAADLATALAA